MSEPTPEERAIALLGRLEQPRWPGTFAIAAEIRAAVAAERDAAFEQGFSEGCRAAMLHPELTEAALLADFKEAIRALGESEDE